MVDKIQLEIVTPRGRALTTSVDEVTAPSVNGEFGVLPGHLPLLAALRTGIVSYKQGSETTRVAVGAGFAEAGPDKLVILTDEYAERAQLDPVLIRKELGEIEQQLAKLERDRSNQKKPYRNQRRGGCHQNDHERKRGEQPRVRENVVHLPKVCESDQVEA